MGAWGHEAFENDHALDWVGEVVNDDFWGKIKTALEGENHDEIRAAAGITIAVLSGCRATAPYQYDIRKIAYDSLKRIMWDGKWLDSWDDPAEVIKYIQKQLRELESIDPSTTLLDSIEN